MNKSTFEILKTRWLQKLAILCILLLLNLGAKAQLPDLIISEMGWENLNGADDYIERGDTIIFHFTGKNVGNDSTPAGTTLGGQFRVSELDHGWILYEQAGWSVLKDSFMLVGDSVLFISDNGGALNNGKWVAGPPGNYKIFVYFDDAGGTAECKRICEEDEDNNFWTDYFTVHPIAAMPDKLPDLAVKDIQFVDAVGDPLIPTAGNDVLFKATIQNIGADTAFSDGSKIKVSFHVEVKDSVIASTSTTELFDTLAPGETITVMSNFSEGRNNGTADGSWLAVAGDTIIICEVDADSVVEESCENNNLLPKMLYVDVAAENQKPDLVITDILFNPEVAIQGDLVELSVILKNAGTKGIAPGTDIRAIWKDEAGDLLSITIGDNRALDTIPPDGTDTITGNFEGFNGKWLAPDPGIFLINAEIDQAGAVDEAIENNNSFQKKITVVHYPDLAVKNLTWTTAPDTIEALSDAVFTASVENIFGGPVKTTDTLIITWNVSGIGDVGSDTALLDQPLDMGESVNFIMPEPWFAFSGNRLVTATLNAGSIIESYTDNNKVADSVYVKKYPGPLPDLEVIQINWTPENPREGDTIWLSAVIKNTGDAATIAGYGIIVYFHINGSQVGWTIDDQVYTASLGIGEEIELFWNRVFAGRYFKAPRYTEGDHTVRATVDKDMVIEEKDDDNNILEIIVTMGPPRLPDLTVSDLSWSPADPVEDEMVTLSAYIKNTGEKELTDTIYVTWSKDDVTIDSVMFADTLLVGDSLMVSGSNTWQAEGGTHTITVTVDAHGAVVESDDENNTASGDLTVIGTLINNLKQDKFAIYPNPADNILKVDYLATEARTVLFKISNILGEVMMDRSIKVLPGLNRFEFNIENLPEGMYFIQSGSYTSGLIVR